MQHTCMPWYVGSTISTKLTPNKKHQGTIWMVGVNFYPKAKDLPLPFVY
jgi:hypothetical protein